MINTISKWLALQLDKLKIKLPIVYLAVQSALGLVLALFLQDHIVLPTPEILTKVLALFDISDLNDLVEGILVALMALISPRTTFLKNQLGEDGAV